MFGESQFKPRHNSHQGRFEKKRENERRWEQSVQGIAATDKVCNIMRVERREVALAILCLVLVPPSQADHTPNVISSCSVEYLPVVQQ